jgi:hypothetical protein
MNANVTEPGTLLPIPDPDPADPVAPKDWRYWAKRLFVCNPFFLCSAALLLFALNQLSAEEKLFRDEIQNLLFNFSALQFYELLVVLTAVVLARRKVWYDSSLLVVLEQGLALVPFMLISQATMQGGTAREGLSLAWTLALCGGAVALARYVAVRRWFPRFNLPPRALLLGALILLANVALPLVFRPRMEKDVADWREENLVLWYVILPILAAGANLLRRPARYGGLHPERHWLPLFIYALWVTGSAIHVWCVAHICDLPLKPHHLAPLACVLAWTLWNRLSDFLPSPSLHWRRTILGLTFAAPLLAFNESHLFTLLAGVTHVAYVLLWLRTSDTWVLRSTVKHLALASLAVLVAGIPEEWARAVLPALNRPRCIALACSLFALLHALRSRRPESGLAGAVAVGIALAFDPALWRPGFHAIIQSSLVFLLLHSLRWPDELHPRSRRVRWSVAMAWTIDALVWTKELRWDAILMASFAAMLVLAAWFLVWWLRRERPSTALLVAATLVLCAAPGHWAARHGPAGLFALLASLMLFAAGVVLAWTRHRWDRPTPN